MNDEDFNTVMQCIWLKADPREGVTALARIRTTVESLVEGLQQVEANRDSLLDTIETMRDYIRIMDHVDPEENGEWINTQGEQPW